MAEHIIVANNISKKYYLDSKVSTSMKSELASRISSIFSDSKKNERNALYALKDISFSLEKGESLGIIGRNGAGKSTLLKIISGIIEPSEGSVELFGTSTSILEIGTGLHPDLTGHENIISYCELLGFSKDRIEEVYDDIVNFSELGDFINTPVKYYSSGMILRLAFSVVIQQTGDIMLFDEVMAVGDIAFRTKCLEHIISLKNERQSFLLVSHNLNEIANYCDKILLLEKGEVVAFGKLADIAKSYYQLSLKYKSIREKMRPKGPGIEKLVLDDYYNAEVKSLVGYINMAESKVQYGTSKTILHNAWLNNNKKGDILFSYTDDINLTFDIEKIEENTELVSFTVSDMMDNKLLGGYVNSDTGSYEQSFSKGRQLINWIIPKQLLNNGIYKISFFILNDELKPEYRLLNILSFEVKSDNAKDDVFRHYTPLRLQLQSSVSKFQDQ